jgi:copper chaperone
MIRSRYCDTPRRYEMISGSLIYSVPGVSCEHCRAAITKEVTAVSGVQSVEVDLTRKLVSVRGQDVDGAQVRAAIDEAGYDVADETAA